jgi:hypothetical protein
MLSSDYLICISAYKQVTADLSTKYASRILRAIASGTCCAVFVMALFSGQTYSHGQMVKHRSVIPLPA